MSNTNEITNEITRAGVILFKEEVPFEMSKILLIRHPYIKSQKTGTMVSMWDIPKGHKNKEESLEECASRELYEETGIHITDFNGFQKFQIKKKLSLHEKRAGL